jgi:serine/threonine protein kinase
VTDLDLNDFEMGDVLRLDSERRVLTAIRRDSGETVRLSLFSAEISQRAEFRRSVKMDRAMLAMLKHQSIVRFLGYGESDGTLFLATESSDFTPLSDQLTAGRCFSSEDIIEIGWQICSALQLAHNLGLAHGGLSTENVLLSDSLQVTIVDFGVARWLRAAAVAADDSANSGPALITISALASREDVERDLRDLASLLKRLLQACNDDDVPEQGKVATTVMMERLLGRFEPSNTSGASHRPVSAREFQGRLGEILIGTGDDSMPLVDHRNVPTTSRRSIVVELFEPTASLLPADAGARGSATFAWRKQILPIAVSIVVLLVLWLLAGRLW